MHIFCIYIYIKNLTIDSYIYKYIYCTFTVYMYTSRISPSFSRFKKATYYAATADCIIIDGQFHAFQRFSGSRLPV